VNYDTLRRIKELESLVAGMSIQILELKAEVQELKSKRTLTLPKEKYAGYRQASSSD
jgi:hypothetical protein